jgi:hypothetical protein
MTETAAVPPAQTPVEPPLSQWQRLANIFLAPSKTFADIRRDSNWWLPFLLSVVVSLLFSLTVQQKVGWEKVVENTIAQSPRMQESLSNLTPEAAAHRKQSMAAADRYISWTSPVLTLLLAALVSLVLLATLNFGFAGHATFQQMLAVYFYATLPMDLKYLLAILALNVGMSPDQFSLQNPIGSNLGYFLSLDNPGWLVALATQIGIFAIWGLILFSMGSSIVARVKRSQGWIAVGAWWLVLVALATVGGAFR